MAVVTVDEKPKAPGSFKIGDVLVLKLSEKETDKWGRRPVIFLGNESASIFTGFCFANNSQLSFRSNAFELLEGSITLTNNEGETHE